MALAGILAFASIFGSFAGTVAFAGIDANARDLLGRFSACGADKRASYKQCGGCKC